MPSGIDLFVVNDLLKRLSTPFNQTDAYRLGLIDADGNRLKRALTPQQQAAMGYVDRLVFNLKRILSKVPAGNTLLSSYAAATLLMREQNERLNYDDEYLLEQFNSAVSKVSYKDYQLIEDLYKFLMEDAPTNATGAAVVGTGENQVHWRRRQPKMGPSGKSVKKYGQALDGIAFIRRNNKKVFERGRV